MADVGAPLRVLSICSGIGGLDLGVRRALHSRVVAYVERDTFAASVLLARMEDEALDPAPLWVGDLRDLDPEPLAGHIGLVVGGFPCPPFSVAGKQLGAGDERDLWPEVARIIRGVGASLVFLENVGGAVRHPDGLGRWLGDLAELGFDAEWATVRACDTDQPAPHRRERLFILAHHSDDHRRSRERGEDVADRGSQRPQGDREGRAASGTARRGCGAEVPARGAPAVDTVPGLRELPLQPARLARARLPVSGDRGLGDQPIPPWPPGPDADWSGIPEHLHPATQPGLRRVAHGLPDLLERAQSYRTDRLRALGNAVVPAQAEHALRLLLARIGS